MIDRFARRRAADRAKVQAAWAWCLENGVAPTAILIGERAGMNRCTVYGHLNALGLSPAGREASAEVGRSLEDRVAAVRAAKIERAALGGLDERTLRQILPD